jgi:phage-related protein
MRPFTAHGRESGAELDGIYKFLYSKLVKDVVFVGSACDDLRSFSVEARQRAGYQLYLVQVGLDPSDWRPMASVGSGCREIRVRADTGAYRVLYVATIGDAVYVLHCFQKKTQRTAKADIGLATQRYRQVTEMTRAKEAP